MAPMQALETARELGKQSTTLQTEVTDFLNSLRK